MNATVALRFVMTAAGAGAAVVPGAVVGVLLYEAFWGSDGFEAFVGGLYGGPVGIFLGAWLGNSLARKMSKEPPWQGRRAAVLIESVGFSAGVVIAAFVWLSTEGSVGNLGGWTLITLLGVGGFALGFSLAASLAGRGDRSTARTRS